MPSELLSVPQARDFALEDQLGRRTRLADLVAQGPLVLTFYRGHWCPYCRRYLGKIQSQLPRVRSLGAQVAAISPEPPATSRVLVDQLGLQFPLLSDPAGEVIQSYGVRNNFSAVTTLLPHPAVFIIDQERNVRFKSIDRNYKRRTTLRTVFGALEDLSHG